METVKEIIIIIAFVAILIGALFIGGKYLINSVSSDNNTAIEDVKNGDNIDSSALTKIIDEKNNEKLNKYIEKYDNDKTMGVVAYILSRIQIYSVPICVLLFVYGAFLYWIVSAEKLVDGERGYGYIVSSIIFLTIAQIAPLVFALISSSGRG